MSQKVLLDQGLPRSAAEHLRRTGIDSVHTAEIGMAAAEDSKILQRSRDDDRVIVTLDADFHRLMAFEGASQPSIIRIRIEGLKGDELARLLEGILQSCSDELAQGALVTVQEHGIRIRRLPLPRPS